MTAQPQTQPAHIDAPFASAPHFAAVYAYAAAAKRELEAVRAAYARGKASYDDCAAAEKRALRAARAARRVSCAADAAAAAAAMEIPR
jgi:hypothetical protein